MSKLPSGWQLKSLGSLLREPLLSGFASGKSDEDGALQIRMNNVAIGGAWNWTKTRRIPASKKQLSKYNLDLGDVLFNSTNSPNLVGKTAIVGEGNPAETYSNHFIRVRPDVQKLDSSYLWRWINLLWSRRVFEGMCTQWVNQASVRKENLEAIEIPLPPNVEEQKRIAAILDKADDIRRKRQETLTLTESLIQSTFLDMFGDPMTNPKGWEMKTLESSCDIMSGITKGRKVKDQELKSVPYMRVANVQDGQIDLGDIATIDASAVEIERYHLEKGDILLTEGGDPDKLGRGGIWQGEVSPCIHQNHVFRVRICTDELLPEYVSSLIGSASGKRYFLKCAKQTTGIASINKTQLKAFPLLIPDMKIQKRFSNFVKDQRNHILRLSEHETETNNLFNSLQQRAFRGELSFN